MTGKTKSRHVSDYDILVVTATKEVALDVMLWKKIGDECRNLKLSADPRIITHDVEELNRKLSQDQYFYSDIKKEGIEIFDSGKFELAEKKKLTPQERKKIAEDHFEYWFPRAKGFYKFFKIGFAEINFNYPSSENGIAAFHLHQASESALKAILLVFTNYNPNEHFLKVLKGDCSEYFPELRELFPVENKKDEARFELLDYAYIGGRYDPNYKISKEDLEILAQDVEKLLDLTKRVCEEKISSLI